MGYRGYGSFRGDLSMEDSGSEDVGLDLSSYPDVGQSEDFSDVTGGSSTVDEPDILTGGLSGSSIMRALGSGSSVTDIAKLFTGTGAMAAAGSAAAAGMRGAIPAAKGIARLMGRRFGTAGSTHTAVRRVSSWQVRDARRMNVFNRKAAHRALHRIGGLERAMRHIVHFTHPAPHARVKFKFHRRRRKR